METSPCDTSTARAAPTPGRPSPEGSPMQAPSVKARTSPAPAEIFVLDGDGPFDHLDVEKWG